MKHYGQPVSSAIYNLSINFHTSKNNHNKINILHCLQDPTPLTHTTEIQTIEHKIININNAPFITLKSNLCERPLKFLLDTGASLSLIADDIILDQTTIHKFIINICGITGKEASIRTQGLIKGLLTMGNEFIPSTFHIINRKYSGPADGYLGYDFLFKYGATIDIKNMNIQMKLKKIQPTLPKSIEKYTHNIPTKNNICDDDTHKSPNHLNQYSEATIFHKKQIEKTNETKVHAVTRNYTINHTFQKQCTNRANNIYSSLQLNHCTPEEKKFIHSICQEFSSQFYLEGDNLASTNIIEHSIKLIPNAGTINIRQYRIPQTYKQILQEFVNDYEKQGLIEKCQSEFNSPALIVPKKDDAGNKNDFRFVIDYKKLNQITEIQNFPIPLIDDILIGLSGCKYFTTLDIKGAFHQIILNKASRDYTAFTAGNFKYRWLRMPMGLASSPLIWQRAINTILANLIGNGVYVYLDDVIIYAKSKPDHDQILRTVMFSLKKHNLQLKISKCLFYAKTFEYLGHIITEHGIRANPKKIETIKNYPRPSNTKEIQKFMGLCSYFRRYVRDFSKHSRPLTMLLKNEQPFVWTESQQKAFNKLRETLTQEVTLAFPNFDKLFYVTTDASDIAIGAMLSQGELPNDRPIYFFSRTLNDTQKRYSTIQKELLAMVEAIKAFRVYLYGRFFISITDHKALCYLFNTRDCGSRLFRQKLELLDYNFKILYRPGAQNRSK